MSGRVARAAAWNGAHTVVTRLLNIVITAIVLRLMTPEDFGVFAVAVTVFVVVSALSELGLSICLARADVDPDEIGPTVALLSLLVSGTFALLLFAAAGPLARAVGAPDATDPLRVLSLCVLLIGVFTVPCGLIMREFRQEANLVATLVSSVPGSALLIVMAANGDGAMAFAWSRVLGQVVFGCVLTIYARKLYVPKLDRRHLGPVLRFGLPVAGAGLLQQVLLNGDYLFVGYLLGAEKLGIYMLAFNVGSWATAVLASVINNVAMPAFSREKADPERLRAALRTAVVLVGMVAFPLATVTLVLAGPLVHTLYGATWDDAAPVLQLLSVYGALFAFSLLFGQITIALGRPGRLFVTQAVWLVCLMPAMAVGASTGGLRGAALAHIVTIVVVAIPTLVWPLRTSLPGAVSLVARASVAPFGIAVASAAAAWGASAPFGSPLLKLLVGGVASLVVYAVLAPSVVQPHLPDRLARLLDRPLRFRRALLPHTGRRSEPSDSPTSAEVSP